MTAPSYEEYDRKFFTFYKEAVINKLGDPVQSTAEEFGVTVNEVITAVNSMLDSLPGRWPYVRRLWS